MEELERQLLALEGASYGAYRQIQGRHELNFTWGDLTLNVERVQSDPFASPSRMRVMLPLENVGIPRDLFSTAVRRVAVEDFLTRQFFQVVQGFAQRRGSGGSGRIEILEPSQVVLERDCMAIGAQDLAVRFRVGLPGNGRRLAGREAARLLCGDLPEIVRRSLLYSNLDGAALRCHVETVEDAVALRSQLRDQGLIAFVANGAMLARDSGVSDRPMVDAEAFQSPASLAVTLPTPNGGEVTGMGIPAGVTLIVGGGFHGKSTVLRALSLGIYNHIPGDGRERVVVDETAVKIRAEDGRNVCAVDLSAFINNLPRGRSTEAFSTNNASGSTSQAANLLEAVEAGASVLLMDEDSCATNFLVRDARMQALIQHEPITPLVDRVVSLYEDFGVSTVLVMGGCGDYLDVASLVIGLEDFRVVDLTNAAREIVKRWPSQRQASGGMLVSGRERPLAWGFETDRFKVKVQGCEMLRIGRDGEIDLTALEQLVEPGQVRAIAEMLISLGDGESRTVAEIRAWLEGNHRLGHDGVAVRSLEILAAINRLRGLATGG